MTDVTCDCGEVVQMTTDELVNFAITECPNCLSEICLEEAFNDYMDSLEFAKSFYTNNSVA